MLANTTSQSETLIHTAAASHLELNAAGASERFGLTHSNRRSWLARVIGGSTLLGCIGSWSPLVVAEEETSKRRGEIGRAHV